MATEAFVKENIVSSVGNSFIIPNLPSPISLQALSDILDKRITSATIKVRVCGSYEVNTGSRRSSAIIYAGSSSNSLGTQILNIQSNGWNSCNFGSYTITDTRYYRVSGNGSVNTYLVNIK